MSRKAIVAVNISKRFYLSHQSKERYTALRDVISNKAKNLFAKSTQESSSREEFWALKDVSFEINEGDRVGIIGRNGAGKSTLLKVLSRIVTPTSGKAIIDGRVGSLLEVGTGFHPELSGRENVFLNGAILGMSRQEIKSKFDEIVAFAEVERFLDTPVKRYSSGMYVRLAFAVAAHLEPEILIVDEVLAVGDAEFQRKCLGKMEEVSGQGRTVLFVSHSLESVQRLCNKGILLESGQLKMTGDAREVIKMYMNTGAENGATRSWQATARKPGNGIVQLLRVYAHTADGSSKEVFDITQPIGITMEYEVLKEGEIFTHSYNFFNEEGTNIFNTHDTTSPVRLEPRKKGVYKATMWIQGNLLSEGMITMSVAAMKIDPFAIHFHEHHVISFNVVDYMRGDSARGSYILGFPGMVRPLCQWNTELTIHE